MVKEINWSKRWSFVAIVVHNSEALWLKVKFSASVSNSDKPVTNHCRVNDWAEPPCLLTSSPSINPCQRAVFVKSPLIMDDESSDILGQQTKPIFRGSKNASSPGVSLTVKLVFGFVILLGIYVVVMRIWFRILVWKERSHKLYIVSPSSEILLMCFCRFAALCDDDTVFLTTTTGLSTWLTRLFYALVRKRRLHKNSRLHSLSLRTIDETPKRNRTSGSGLVQ
jgi:hypothetical protein